MVTFAIKDYDLVGPEDFHKDRSLDKYRSGAYDNKPWLQVNITFTSAILVGKKTDKQAELMSLELAFPLDENHLQINKPKRSFRAQKPISAKVSKADAFQKCNSLTFAFQVRNEYIKYILEDQGDECFPFTVEGKWHLNFTEEEAREELLEEEVIGDIEHLTETEKLDLMTDNDVLIGDLGNKMDSLTKAQFEALGRVIKNIENEKQQLKQK